MCPPTSEVTENKAKDAAPAPAEKDQTMTYVAGFLGLCTAALLASTIALAIQKNEATAKSSSAAAVSNVPSDTMDMDTVFSTGTNQCDKKKLDFQNVDCIHTPG